MKKSKIALAGGMLIDGNGGKPIDGSIVLIEGDRICFVGKKEDSNYQDYEVIDTTGMFVLPGLIESHVHLGGVESSDPVRWVLEDDRRQMIRAVKQAETLLTYGFTTVRDISRNGIALRESINAGEMIGPRIHACGVGLSRRGGHGDTWELPLELNRKSHPWATIADGEDEVRKTVRDLLRGGADSIKVWASGGGLWERERETDQHYSYRELEVIVEEASYYNAAVVAHCECLSSVKAALMAGARSIEHGEILDDWCIEWMKTHHVFLVPTFSVFFDWFEKYEPNYKPEMDSFPGNTMAEKEINRIIDNFQRAKNAGVKIAMGSDSFCNAVTPYGEYSFKEIYRFLLAGCSASETISYATKAGAELMGMDKEVGTVEEGKFADLLLLRENPLDNIYNLKKENIEAVFKGGVMV